LSYLRYVTRRPVMAAKAGERMDSLYPEPYLAT